MPTEEENTQYLYLVLTNGGNPTIDWDAVGTAMDLKKGAVSKRWSRLKKSMEAGETPSGSVYKFLWLCVKHSTRDKTLDWNAIAEKCGTTSGAASKRYSRMKQAFEAGAEPPNSGPASPGGAKTPKATPKKAKATAGDGEGTPTPKRKRAPAKKVKEEVKDEDEVDEEEQAQSPKKPRVAKKKATTKAKGAEEETSAFEEASQVKSEVKEEGEGGSVDVNEWVGDLVDAGEEVVV